ncbi:hypothetical protein Fleli_3042 [Bernardetia litoralis DSM 6794]|uniref:Uncharacterized protein n=1 Tax=Bernardetia litoralis (strain ATCC 23117 / DSM 6794 / NBRC 15988 / NCIMB 1366 / Fx l1 / Sio-4) TaxID=880071 RepID=I4AN48_BERLS|nr:hypothetical protein [Bernardetia litoralis]AFM05383.1 hypothetical protein Fleli_3042 [Bernardetia litoralis DSM 6794]
MNTHSTSTICLLITEEYCSSAFYNSQNLLSIPYEGKERIELFFEIDTQIKPISKKYYESLDVSVNVLCNPSYGIEKNKTFDWLGASHPYEKLFDSIVENIKIEFERLSPDYQGVIPLLCVFSPAFSENLIEKFNVYFTKKGFHILPHQSYIDFLVEGKNLTLQASKSPLTFIESFGERIRLTRVGENNTTSFTSKKLQDVSDWDFERELVKFVLQRAMRQVPTGVDLDEEVALHSHRAEEWLNQIREEKQSFITVRLSNGTSATATINSQEVQLLRIQDRELAERVVEHTQTDSEIYLVGDLLLQSELKSLLVHRHYTIHTLNDEEATRYVLRGIKNHLDKQEKNEPVLVEETLIKEAIPQFLVYQYFLPKKIWNAHVNSQNWNQETVDKVVKKNALEVLPSLEILLNQAQELAKDELLSTEQMKSLRIKARELEISEDEFEQRLKAAGIRVLPLRELLETNVERRKVGRFFPSEYYPQLLAVAEQNGFSEKELNIFFRQRNLKLQTREEILDFELQDRLKGKILSQENFKEILDVGDKLHYSKSDIEILLDKRKIKLSKPKGIGIFLIAGIIFAVLALGIILALQTPNLSFSFSNTDSNEIKKEFSNDKIENLEELIGKYAGTVFHTELNKVKNSRIEILAVREENGEYIFTYSIPQDRFTTWKGKINLEEKIIDFMPPENARHRVNKYRFYRKNYKEANGTIRRSDIILENLKDSTQIFTK